jgi:hypothetical protein
MRNRLLMGMVFILENGENVLEFDNHYIQLCQYTKKHWTVHFKEVNYSMVIILQ